MCLTSSVSATESEDLVMNCSCDSNGMSDSLSKQNLSVTAADFLTSSGIIPMHNAVSGEARVYSQKFYERSVAVPSQEMTLSSHFLPYILIYSVFGTKREESGFKICMSASVRL